MNDLEWPTLKTIWKHSCILHMWPKDNLLEYKIIKIDLKQKFAEKVSNKQKVHFWFLYYNFHNPSEECEQEPRNQQRHYVNLHEKSKIRKRYQHEKVTLFQKRRRNTFKELLYSQNTDITMAHTHSGF